MNRLLLPLLAALAVLSGCVGSSSADGTTAEPTTGSPQFNAGQVEIAGLKLALDPEVWKEVEHNGGKLILQYQPEGVSCERPSDCSRVTLARETTGQDGDYYQANDGKPFATTVQCNGGLWQRGAAVEQTAVTVGEEAFEHFINDPCADLHPVKADPTEPRSFVWFSDERNIVIRFDEMASGVRLGQTGLEFALEGATLAESR
jgi:hypothetical protein